MYEGFSIDHEADIQGRRVDMEICRINNNYKLNFLVLELQRYSYSNSDQALEDGETQLKGYLGSLSNTRERMLWGALCIGKSVQFYQCSKEGGDVELFALHEDADLMACPERKAMPKAWGRNTYVWKSVTGTFIGSL
ncbi:hypothetical protein FNYG_02823 [Fusarium nygamai]|uniref:Fungal-type protein kinase domain-containing protein n=1 Tax=Gibberella nygamai TaxID=42673 RepID=A0A2K0WPD5_GIBNY|nr:hypothetical protein FNYG_02823 [Fusarium nygamai]